MDHEPDGLSDPVCKPDLLANRPEQQHDPPLDVRPGGPDAGRDGLEDHAVEKRPDRPGRRIDVKVGCQRAIGDHPP